MTTTPTRCVVLGATGSVGVHVVNNLVSCGACTEVVVLTRRSLPEWKGNPRVIQATVDFSALTESSRPHIKGCTAAFSCFGVGAPRKVTKEEFHKVDVVHVKDFMKVCKEEGVTYMAYLSSVGASADATGEGHHAGGGFYFRAKAEVENYAFDLFPSAAAFRPSALVGSPNTPWGVGGLMNFFRCLIPKNYEAMDVTDIGKAIVCDWVQSQSSGGGPIGSRIIHVPDMKALLAKKTF